MKRPMLVSGIAVGLSCAILVLAGIGALPFLLLGAVSVLILYFIKPLKLRARIIIPAVCISVITACIFFGGHYFTKVLPAQRLDKTITSISGKVISTPQETTYGTKFLLKTDKIGGNNQAVKIQVTLPANKELDVKLYDYVSIHSTELKIVRDDYNNIDASSASDGIILETKASSVSSLWECEKTPYYYCLRFKEIVTEQIQAYLDKVNSGVLLGMLFGGSTNLDSDVKSAFQGAGIAHLLAVSGLHTSTWCAYIIMLLSLFKIKEKPRNLFCILFLVVLCIVSGFTPSVLRASLMMAVILFAPFFNEEQDPLNSLGLAVTALALANPYIVASLSFLLSASATLGVLLSINVVSSLSTYAKKIKPYRLRRVTNYLSNSLVTSCFAGIFTLPVFAYYFGIFSIASPIANLLCVTPAFIGMLAGVVSTMVSFIPIGILHSLAIILFKVTALILTYVTSVARALSGLKISTLPIHKEYFILCIGLILVAVTLTALIHNRTKSRAGIKICSIACSVVFILGVIFPCTTITPATISVISVDGGVNVALRQGLDYAYFNCGTSENSTPSDYLPKAKCESLKLLYVSKANTKTNALTKSLIDKKPQTTVLTPYAMGELNEAYIDLAPNTIIADTYSYNFNKEITIQIVDTYPVCCVIIKRYEDMAMICYGNSDLSYLFDSYGTPDTLVLSTVPDSIPENVETIVISSDASDIVNKSLSTLKGQCKCLYTTAEDGDIKIIL